MTSYTLRTWSGRQTRWDRMEAVSRRENPPTAARQNKVESNEPRVT